ncbi:ferroxidase fet3 [Boothiomyces sp. JEL0866]|nr:ferroxidase fet3 [Boothiomyces sp. JEL0866]
MHLWAILIPFCVSEKIRTFKWSVTQFLDAPDGVTRSVIGINGKPGYDTSIIVDQGDTVVVDVKNMLDVPTSIHWHGMFQNGTNESDGPVGITQCPIQPGKTFQYKFKAARSGTFWWHGHFGTQYIDGLKGPLIIRDKVEPYALEYDYEYIVQLTDWYHTSAAILDAQYLDPNINPGGNEPVWSSGLINGRGFYNCSLEPAPLLPCSPHQTAAKFDFVPGKRYRLRIINNAAFAAFNFSIPGHQLRVIEADGALTNGKAVGTNLQINTAQRYSVIVIADQKPQTYQMQAILLDNTPWTSLPIEQEDTGLIKTVIADIVYQKTYENKKKTYPVHPYADIDVFNLVPYCKVRVPSHSDRKINFNFTFTSTDTNPANLAYVSLDNQNAYSFLPPVSNPVNVQVVHDKTAVSALSKDVVATETFPGEVIDIVIMNNDGGEHPLHLHGHDFWILAQGWANDTTQIPTSFSNLNHIKRDTITVPACETDSNGDCINFQYTILRYVSDNPGVWTFHCHIDWHLTAGLGMVIVEDLKTLQARGMNTQTLKTCGL